MLGGSSFSEEELTLFLKHLWIRKDQSIWLLRPPSSTAPRLLCGLLEKLMLRVAAASRLSPPLLPVSASSISHFCFVIILP